MGAEPALRQAMREHRNELAALAAQTAEPDFDNTVAGFDRDAYRIGPGFTEGWLARVQSLAKVVAVKGTVDLSLFAKTR